MEISKIQILTIIAIVVIFVLLFPIPMSRSREELYSTTETYYDESVEIVNETVSFPYQVFKSMQWEVTWYTLTVDREWGASIGTEAFDSTFSYDWGAGIVYGGYDDGVGFQAAASFYLEAPGMYTFSLGSDDGSRLYVDDEPTIDSWHDGQYRVNTQARSLSEGWHTLRIVYYEWINFARVYFDIDKGDLFIWEETEYLAVEIPRIEVEQIPKQRITVANKTVTETVYLSLLEYLMRGGHS
jgi:hypothetical protein